MGAAARVAPVLFNKGPALQSGEVVRLTCFRKVQYLELDFDQMEAKSR